MKYKAKQVRRTLCKYDLVSVGVEVGEGVSLEMVEVSDPYEMRDALIAEDRVNSGERFPYWAEVWPSAIALARWFREPQAPSARQHVLELGCGLGLVGIALAEMGWQVQATDFVEGALIFASHNARLNRVGRYYQVDYLDWRHPVGAPCRCIVAADIVYEKKNHPHVDLLLRHLLEPGGRLFLSDPNRPAAEKFCQRLIDQGYSHATHGFRTKWKSLEHNVNIHLFQKPM